MKTNAVSIAVLASALGACAQGLIFFNNGNATRVSTNAWAAGYPVPGLTAAAPNLFYYALFYSTTATTVHGSTNAVIFDGLNLSGSFVFDDSNWAVTAYGTNSPFVAGRFSSSALNADGSTTINEVPPGAFAQFVVLGWSANLGPTVPALLNSLYSVNFYPGFVLGESAVSGPLQLGNGTSILVPNLFGTTPPQISGFTMGPFIPEPSALALAVVGFAGYLFFHRRQGA